MTSTTLEETALAVACDIADQLEYCSNTADGVGLAEPFADDADVITSQGVRLTGRREIGARASEVLARGSHDGAIDLRVVSVRCTSATTLVSLIELFPRRRPADPAGQPTTALVTVVIAETVSGWEVTNLHNTVRGAP